jgi:peptidoglycan/LPS O-acetylase OafA/YrhL
VPRAFVATLIITIPIATLSFFLIEKPGQDLGKRLIARLKWGRARDAARSVQTEPLVQPPVLESSPAVENLAT